MVEVTPQLVSNRKVLLRLDLDVLIGSGQVKEDFRLKADLPTLKLCVDNAQLVTAIGHIGRPVGQVIENLRVAPIVEWFSNQGFAQDVKSGKLKFLENLRFDPREEGLDERYAKELTSIGGFFVNEAFAAHHPASSTTILPTLLPHAAGLRFTKEVRVLTGVRENPKRPFVVIIGGVKVEDKLPAIKGLSKIADAVLVGGKLVQEIREQNLELPANVLVGNWYMRLGIRV